MIKYFVLFISLFSIFMNAQEVNVSGSVYDAESGELLPGASIVVSGTNIGTTTDFDGNFFLNNIPINNQIVVSYLGYDDYTTNIETSTTLSIGLELASSKLDEIVVIGYGTQTKKEVTGAVTVIGSESIQKLNPTRVEQALQGQVSGVNITSGSGSPGSGLNIRIRGISTNGYKLDPSYYFTLPNYSWDAMLLYTQVKLERILAK